MTLQLAATLLWFSALASDDAAATIEPNDFAYGIEMSIGEDDGPIQTLLLPQAVYRGASSADLRDLAVFNAGGEVVPSAVRRLGNSSLEVQPISLPLYPILGSPSADSSEVSLQVQRDPNGTVISVEAATSSANETQVLRAYIIDASAVPSSARPRALVFEWPEDAPDFVGSVNIEVSEDMNRWTTLLYDQTLAKLSRGERRLERKTVPIASGLGDFVRLSWQDERAPVELSSVVLELLPETVGPQRQTLSAGAEQRDDEPFTLFFDFGGPLPVDEVSVYGLPVNTVLETELASSNAPEGPWTNQGTALVYNVEYDGILLTSSSFRVRPERHRYWRLSWDGGASSIGVSAPYLEARFVPEQLVFVRQGEAPYLLAFGSQRVTPSRFDANELLSVLPQGAALALESVYAGPREILAGSDALRPPPKAAWKRYLLWAVLLAGVALLVAMSVGLLRQLNRSGP